MNKIIIYAFTSFISGGLIVYLTDKKYIKLLINKNNILSLKNEKLLYELNKIKKEIELLKQKEIVVDIKKVVKEKENKILDENNIVLIG
jgi:hypothetical protein